MTLASEQEKDLEQIVLKIVKQHFKSSPSQFNGTPYDSTLLERIVRVEERIESLTILMKQNIETMEKRFEAVDKRFEDMKHYTNKRFEDINKRFEAVDKRFEDINKRFEAVDKRFEDMKYYTDKHFEAVNKNVNTTKWMIGVGFTLMTTVILLSNFLAN